MSACEWWLHAEMHVIVNKSDEISGDDRSIVRLQKSPVLYDLACYQTCHIDLAPCSPFRPMTLNIWSFLFVNLCALQQNHHNLLHPSSVRPALSYCMDYFQIPFGKKCDHFEKKNRHLPNKVFMHVPDPKLTYGLCLFISLHNIFIIHALGYIHCNKIICYRDFVVIGSSRRSTGS